MIDQLKSLFNDNRGVSPVIGVILMVAITVILAAVIGTFVLGLGGDLQQTPQAQLNVEDASDSSPANGTSKAVLNINHRGGDTLSEGDFEIRVNGPDATSSETIWNGGSASNATNAVTNGDVGLAGGNAPGDMSVGGTTTVYVTEDTGTNDAVFAGEWEVTIVHVPSDSILLDQTVNVN